MDKYSFFKINVISVGLKWLKTNLGFLTVCCALDDLEKSKFCFLNKYIKKYWTYYSTVSLIWLFLVQNYQKFWISGGGKWKVIIVALAKRAVSVFTICLCTLASTPFYRLQRTMQYFFCFAIWICTKHLAQNYWIVGANTVPDHWTSQSNLGPYYWDCTVLSSCNYLFKCTIV